MVASLNVKFTILTNELYLIQMPFDAFAEQTLFTYGNMIRNDPTLVAQTSNFFVLCTNVKVYLYNYLHWVELSMNIHEGKG